MIRCAWTVRVPYIHKYFVIYTECRIYMAQCYYFSTLVHSQALIKTFCEIGWQFLFVYLSLFSHQDSFGAGVEEKNFDDCNDNNNDRLE